jgi:nucleotide-binding universal stress UspA family protein
MRDILAYANNYRNLTRNLSYAAELAALLDGSLTGIYVQEPILPLPAFNAPELLANLYSIASEQALAAQAFAPAFISWTSEHGVKRSRWQVAEGRLPEVLAYAGNWHDLLVLGVGPDQMWGSASAVGELLLKVGLPCIVVPSACTAKARLESIAIAWNGSPESIRAIHCALPLLKRASRVTLMHGERKEPYSLIDWKPPLDIQVYLAQHGIRFANRSIKAENQQVGKALLQVAAEVDADCVVMGAYGKTRFSEWVFGGATRHVLEYSTIPLLMRH